MLSKKIISLFLSFYIAETNLLSDEIMIESDTKHILTINDESFLETILELENKLHLKELNEKIKAQESKSDELKNIEIDIKEKKKKYETIENITFESLNPKILEELSEYQKRKLQSYIEIRKTMPVVKKFDVSDYLPENIYYKSYKELFDTMEYVDNGFFDYKDNSIEIKEVETENPDNKNIKLGTDEKNIYLGKQNIEKQNLRQIEDTFFKIKISNLEINKFNLNFYNIINNLKIKKLYFEDYSSIKTIKEKRTEIKDILYNRKNYFFKKIYDFNNELIPENKYEEMDFKTGNRIISDNSFELLNKIKNVKMEELYFDNIIDKEVKFSADRVEIDNFDYLVKLFFNKDLEFFKTEKMDEFKEIKFDMKNPKIEFNPIYNYKNFKFYDNFISDFVSNFKFDKYLTKEQSEVIKFILKEKNINKDLNIKFSLLFKLVYNPVTKYQYLHFKVKDLNINYSKLGNLNLNFEGFYPLNSLKYLNSENLLDDVIFKDIDVKLNMFELKREKGNFISYFAEENIHDDKEHKYNWEYNFNKQVSENNKKLNEDLILNNIPLISQIDFIELNNLMAFDLDYFHISIYNTQALRLKDLKDKIKLKYEKREDIKDILTFKIDSL